MFKRLLRTKTFWTGVLSVGTGVGLIVNGDLNGGIAAVVLGVQTIFIRDAIAKNSK